MSEKINFGVFQDNALALSAALAMVISVIAFSLVAAIFLAVLIEMYVGLLAGMIMLGLGGSSFTKDFAVRYLVYAFSVGMKLMSLVMIANIGSQVLLGLANDPTVGNGKINASGSANTCPLQPIVPTAIAATTRTADRKGSRIPGKNRARHTENTCCWDRSEIA
jgi:type IV secretion system protein TrbL